MSEPLAPLLIRYGRMGDMVLQAPLLHLLHRRFGKPCTLLSFGHWAEPLYRTCADVDKLWLLRRRHMPYWLSPQRWALVRALRRHEGPVYVSEDIPHQVRRIRGLLEIAGIAIERCVFLADCDSPADGHWVDRLLALGRMTPRAWPASAYPLSAEAAPIAAPRLELTAADHADARAWRAARGLGDARLVLLQPGNKRTSRRIASRQQEDNKAWPADRWSALIGDIAATGADLAVVLCGSPQEHSLLEDIRNRAGTDRVIVATRDLPVRRLMALAASAHSMISVDTGPAHVAAAVGCPLVVMYGAEPPQRWHRRSACGAPTVKLGGPPRTSVGEIALDEVMAAWRGLLRDADRSGQ